MEEKDIINEEELKNESAVEDQQEDSQEEIQEEIEQEEVSELDALQIKYNELNDKYLRLYSDFDNFRKRTQKEKLELINNAGGDALKTTLSVVDDFERAMANNEEVEDLQAIKEGFGLIHTKLMATLNSKGVKLMEAKGQPFDPELHEAVTQIPAPEEKDKGTCFDVIQNGYYINDKVLRHAKVVVAQ